MEWSHAIWGNVVMGRKLEKEVEEIILKNWTDSENTA